MDEAFENVIRSAIMAEKESHDFYVKLARISKTPSTKALFERLAKEELKHKKLLENIESSQDINIETEQYNDLDIVEDLLLTPLSEFGALKTAFEMTIRKEENSYEGYHKMAYLLPSGKLKELFEMLAGEELKHKDLISAEY